MAKGRVGRSRWSAGLALCLASGALMFTASAGASVATPAAGSEQSTNCLKLVPTSTVRALTGIGAKVYYHTYYSLPAGAPPFDYAATGRIPGWACSWVAVKPPWGGTSVLQNTAFVGAAYGDTAANWKKFEAYYRAGAVFESLAATKWAGAVKLGYGSQGFLVKEDLWAYDNITSSSAAPGFPHYLYVLSVLSRRHNALQIAFDNASVGKTEAEAKRILKGSF